MRTMGVTCGLLLMVAGSIAVVTGEFEGDGTWFLALGLAVVGLVGLIATVAKSVAASPG